MVDSLNWTFFLSESLDSSYANEKSLKLVFIYPLDVIDSPPFYCYIWTFN